MEHVRLSGTAPRLVFSAALAPSFLLTLAGAAPVARAQGALPGSFAPGPCPIPAPEGYTLDCGMLTVAESRQRPTGRAIQLAVAIVRSPNPEKRADPVLFLAGGPGQPALPLVALAPLAFAEILATRDMVFLDQRGTGYSRPALNCAAPVAAPARFFVPLGAALQDRPAQALLRAQLRIAHVQFSNRNSTYTHSVVSTAL